MAAEPRAQNSTAFRAAERVYRRRDPRAPTAAADERAVRASLIDFGAALRASLAGERDAGSACAPLQVGSEQGNAACARTPIALGHGRFTLRDYHPGLVVVPNALSEGEQVELCALVLRRWVYLPYGKTNAGVLEPPAPDEEKDAAVAALGHTRCNSSMSVAEAAAGTRLAGLEPAPPPFVRLPPSTVSWATLGFHYSWNSRSYDLADAAADAVSQSSPVCGAAGFEQPRTLGGDSLQHSAESVHMAAGRQPTQSHGASRSRGPMPHRLSELCRRLVGPDFAAEACILKFYDERASMLAHVDDAEPARSAPVVSLSLGCDAIFLLGGPERESGPILPILLRSGDALLLGGRARLCYHALARVYPHTAPAHLLLATPPPSSSAAHQRDGGSGRGGRAVELSDEERAWLATHRININMRQVVRRPS